MPLQLLSEALVFNIHALPGNRHLAVDSPNRLRAANAEMIALAGEIKLTHYPRDRFIDNGGPRSLSLNLSQSCVCPPASFLARPAPELSGSFAVFNYFGRFTDVNLFPQGGNCAQVVCH